MRLALFRADGSQHLGLGHIMRCLAFAQGLGKIGVRSLFVTKDYEPKITELIQHYGYDIETIPQGCSFAEDASLTSEFASRHNVNLIITDLCHIDTLANLEGYSEYLHGLKSIGRFLVTIDDLNQMPFSSDIVINPNYGAENRNYKFSGSTKFLLGPAYFIFRQEFIEAARVNREIKKEAHNILVTMGGSDPCNLTQKVAKALNRLNVTSLNLRIVIGAGFAASVEQELGKILKDFNGNYELIPESNKMAELMLWSDLAITGGGLTKYETAVTGTPSIIIPHFDQEAESAKQFERVGSTLHLGLSSEINERDIAEAVEKLLEDYALRAKMSKRGRNMVDGKGVERIIAEIPRSVLS